MSQVEQIQSAFSLPGGSGRYLEAVYEFVAWLEPRASTTREDAFGWFRDRFNAVKSAPYYLPLLRDFGVVEMERGRYGAIRITEMGRAVLHAERSAGERIVADRFLTHFVASREILRLFAESDRPLGLGEIHRMLGPSFPSWTTPTQIDFRLSWFQSLGLLRPVRGRVFEITELGREFSAKYPPEVAPRVAAVAIVADRPGPALGPLDSLLEELRSAATDSAQPSRFEAALARAFERLVGHLACAWP